LAATQTDDVSFIPFFRLFVHLFTYSMQLSVITDEDRVLRGDQVIHTARLKKSVNKIEEKALLHPIVS